MIGLTKAKVSFLSATGALLLIALCLQIFVFRSSPSIADVPYSQNVQAVGETKYVGHWTSYGPRLVSNFCPPRAPHCVVVSDYLQVSRGTATFRMSTFKVTEKIKAYDYYLLDVDVTTSARSGNGDGGTGTIGVVSAGPALKDRNDSQALDAKKSGCQTLAVTMATPWPWVSASTTVGHAIFCDAGADLTRSYAGSNATYRATMLSRIHHFTIQRWVKVARGTHPVFRMPIGLPGNSCAGGDGKGHCVRASWIRTTRTITLGTTG